MDLNSAETASHSQRQGVEHEGDHADWRGETRESINARLEAAKEAQGRTRVTLLAMAVVSMMMMIASYNAYLSFDYYWARSHKDDNLVTKSGRNVLIEADLRAWADSRRVSVPLVGVKVNV